MGYDKNTKLITLDKVVIDGEEFLMTTKEREEWQEKQRTLKDRVQKSKYNFEIRRHRTLW